MSKTTAAEIKQASKEKTQIAPFDASKFKIKKRVVIPTISLQSMKEGDALYFLVNDEIRYTETHDEKTGELKMDKNGNPAKLPLLTITRLDTGVFGQIVLGVIVESALKSEGVITGRKFAMQKGASKGAGKVTLWDVVELED